ncbi:unannotated protein [freshwater metagenome]|uniref:Unannotated protein n=1 Tax=freshwater metagenome TaxID=449393 RepID=A0A6J7PJC2_9ZZZZ
MLGAYSRVIQAGRDRMRLAHLTELVLHQVGLHTVHNARDSMPDSCTTLWLYPHKVNLGECCKAAEDTCGV